MENNNNKKHVGGSSSSSSSSSSLDHLFGPRPDSSPSSASSTGLFNSIFPPPSVHGRGDQRKQDLGYGKYEKTGQNRKGCENSGITSKDSIYQTETVEPCYFSSSIYYGGQENYSPRTTTDPQNHTYKKDGIDDDQNGNNSNSASRGNWWQGSLYY